MLNYYFFVVATAGLACVSGCSQKRTEMHYPGMQFTSPLATGKFESLSVLDTVAHDALRRADLPVLFVRLDGKTVLLLSELTRGEAAKHFEKWQEQPMFAGRKPDSETYHRKHQGTIVLQLNLDGPDDNERVQLGIGDLSGQSHDPGVEIGSSRNGPFFRFPLSRSDIIEMFGVPSDEFTRPYTYHN